MDRLEQLRKFVAQRPSDPFPRYALALEHKSRGDAQAAADELTALVRELPTYVPAFLMLGQLHEAAGRTDAAKLVYQAGQLEARKQGNQHALSELTSAFEAL
jgi:Tfp pilus assembly protein PilF